VLRHRQPVRARCIARRLLILLVHGGPLLVECLGRRPTPTARQELSGGPPPQVLRDPGHPPLPCLSAVGWQRGTRPRASSTRPRKAADLLRRRLAAAAAAALVVGDLLRDPPCREPRQGAPNRAGRNWRQLRGSSHVQPAEGLAHSAWIHRLTGGFGGCRNEPNALLTCDNGAVEGAVTLLRKGIC